MSEAKNTQARGQSSSTETPTAPVRQGNQTYLVYLVDIRDRLDPTVRVLYIQADKYGPAWKAARALVATGKPHDEVPKTTSFFEDKNCTKVAEVGYGKHLNVATVLDPTPPKNAGKVDEEKLRSILTSDTASDKEKLDAMKALLDGNVTPAAA